MTIIKPKVALSDTLLQSLIKLPGKVQKKTREAIAKFRQNPTSLGLNYEKLNGPDKRLHSIRVDQCYRIILLKSDNSDTYILLWVDKHDDAYKWAKNRTCGVNPETGAIQVVNVTESIDQEAIEPIPTPAKTSNNQELTKDIFFKFTDKDLKRIGVTDEMLMLVRSIKVLDEIEQYERRIPNQVYEALYMLALGEPYDDVRSELGIDNDQTYDPEDIETALELPGNQQHFLSITDDAVLEAILNEPMAKWRVFLHPSQRKLIKSNFNGPVRVLGGAGTGKTVVAMHRARFLASKCSDNEKVLFTTFTKSLIHDIKQNLQKICSYDEIRKIDIIHIDAWCHNFLSSHNLANEVAYGQHPQRQDYWTQALTYNEQTDLSDDFLRDEWERVIQYHDIESFAEYARIPRPGRNGRLTRAQRKSIWPVFEEYRNLLNESRIWEPADMFRTARKYIISNNLSSGFKHIIADEIQDLHPQAFRLLRAMLPTEEFKQNDLFLVGDGHQNLYGHHIILSQLGINIRGRGRKLKLNYRTPEQTRRWASSVLSNVKINDLDGDQDTPNGYRSILSGPEPQLETYATTIDEIQRISTWINDLKSNNENSVICVTVRTNNELKEYSGALVEIGHKIHVISNEQNDIDDPLPIRIVTHHRIKGLEFDHVCIANCSQMRWVKYSESPSRLIAEKCLLHVAATRTKNSLLITATGSVINQFS